MNCLIVDARLEERAKVLAEYLQTNGHRVRRHEAQLDGPTDALLSCTAWVELAQNQDVVFLHVGDYQKNAPLFFNWARTKLPVFCYTGTAAPAEIEDVCGTPGSHVLCPEPAGLSEAAGHRLVAVVSRWLGCIAGRTDSERFVEGWHRVRDLDVRKEASLASLEKQLADILKESLWTPAQEVDDRLRIRLQQLRDRRIAWEI